MRCAAGHEPLSYAHSDAMLDGTGIERCSHCGHAAFFAQKDFDQRLGCLVLSVGACAALAAAFRFGGVWLVPVLLLFVVADRLYAHRVPQVVICYRCDAEYREVPDVARYRPYDPHIAERDAELKTVRRMR